MTQKEFGQRLRTARQAQRLSLRTVAKQTGMAPSNLSQLEQGDYWPAIPTLIALAEVLETTPNWLLGFTADHEMPPSPDR